MNLNDIRAFVAVVEAGSINRAAAALRLTQPAVSRRVQSLEAALGASLLDRQTKPPSLTPAGRVALERCRAVLRSVEELRADAGGDTAPLGDLRIGVAHGVADAIVAGPVDALMRAFPRVRLSIATGWTVEMLEAGRARRFDAVVAIMPVGRALPAHLDGRDVGIEAIRVVGPRHVRLPARARLADLGGHPWVLNPAGCGHRDALQRALHDRSLPLTIAAEVMGKELQAALVARGLGLGLLSQRFLRTSRLAGRLVPISVTDFRLDIAIRVVRLGPLGRLEAPVARFEEALALALADGSKKHA